MAVKEMIGLQGVIADDSRSMSWIVELIRLTLEAWFDEMVSLEKDKSTTVN